MKIHARKLSLWDRFIISMNDFTAVMGLLFFVAGFIASINYLPAVFRGQSIIGVFVLTFPATGIYLIWSRRPRMVLRIQLYRDGVITKGSAAGYYDSATMLADTRIIAYRYDFEVDGKRYMAEFRSMSTDIAPKKAVVLYLEEDPS